MSSPPNEVRTIDWGCIGPRAQANGLCRYCSARAKFMKKTARGWVLVCEAHAR